MSSGEAMAKILVDSALHPVSVEGVSEGGAGELVVQLRDYRRQLVGVATNLNQVAHHANTVHEVPSDFGEVVAKVLRLHDDIDEILAGVHR